MHLVAHCVSRANLTYGQRLELSGVVIKTNPSLIPIFSRPSHLHHTWSLRRHQILTLALSSLLHLPVDRKKTMSPIKQCMSALAQNVDCEVNQKEQLHDLYLA